MAYPIRRVRSTPPKTHCPQGHAFTPENTYWQYRHGPLKTATAVCKSCDRDRMRRSRLNPVVKARDAAKMRLWRAENRDEYLARVRETRREKKDWLDSQKVKCERCPETHIACLEFHHRNPAEKDFLLSVAVAKYSLDRIKAEAAKCDVLCSNCHRKHHYDERSKLVNRGRI